MKKLPDGWHEVTIEDIASVDSGQGAPQGDKWFKGEKIFIKAGDLNNLTEGKYVGDYCQRISDEAIGHYNLKKYPANSIVFPKSGMSVKTDNIALLKYDSYIVNHLAIVKVKEDLCSEKYLYYLFKGKKISNLSLNDSYPSIRLQDIKNFKALLPPLPTQKKIAAVLEKAEKLREWRKEADGLMDKFLKSTFLEMFGDPIKNPKKWELVKLATVGTLKRGKSKHRPRDAPELLGGPYPLIQTGDVANSGGYIRKYDQTYSELGLNQSKIWPSGTLCITIAANIAKTGVLTFDSCFPDSVVGFIPNNNTKTEYVQFWLSFLQKMLEETAPESAQKNINLEILSNLNIPFPPFELQQKFASIVQQVEQIREHQSQSRQHIENFFNVLMQRAFRGELEAK